MFISVSRILLYAQMWLQLGIIATSFLCCIQSFFDEEKIYAVSSFASAHKISSAVAVMCHQEGKNSL
jgi:hypothetical protein